MAIPPLLTITLAISDIETLKFQPLTSTNLQDNIESVCTFVQSYLVGFPLRHGRVFLLV
jgi:hypothetical protein